VAEAAPSVLEYPEPVRSNDHVIGPIVASVAFVAVWEVVRAVGWGNLIIGAWLVTAPFMLGYTTLATLNSSTTGLAVIALASIRGAVRQRFGGGWTALLRG
jgi:hypothetical protein